MNRIIDKVIGVWQGADGTLAEVIYDTGGGHPVDGREAIDTLIRPLKSLHVLCELGDHQRVVFPFDDIGYILPDRTGMLVVFDEYPRLKKETVLDFSVPDNAAVFNADGTLRFKLKNPCGETGSFWSRERINNIDGTWRLGVRACPRDRPTCDHVYVVDGSTPDLSQQIPLWMRN